LRAGSKLCYNASQPTPTIPSIGRSLLTIADPSSATLIPAHSDQDRRFAPAWAVLRAGIGSRAFPGAAVAITHEGKLVALKGLGAFTYDANAPGVQADSVQADSVQADTIYDVASVSKVVATTAMAMLLYQRGALDLDLPLVSLVPEFRSPEIEGSARVESSAGVPPAVARASRPRSQVTLAQLLAHSSGLPAYERLFERARTRAELLQAAFTTPLTAAPGTRAEYSDIGFIILGVALERLASEHNAGETLDTFCAREIFGPLAMARTGFRPPAALRKEIPPTVDDKAFRRRIVQGEVHDENASVMGGVAGHAGVFAPAEDVARFAHCTLSAGAPGVSLFRPATVKLFTARQTSPPGTSRALGWDTPPSPSQSGKYFCAASYGHLGYTGTSLWCDPERQLSVTLLTNRTWPDRSSQQIKQVRPAFHDAVVECLG